MKLLPFAASVAMVLKMWEARPASPLPPPLPRPRLSQPGLGGPWSLFSCPAWRQGCSWCLAVSQLQGFYADLPGGSCGWAAGKEAVSRGGLPT